jgi:hypothetical protein
MFVTISLEDVGRENDQAWWAFIAEIAMLGTAWSKDMVFFIVLAMWFALGFRVCIWLERLLARAYRRLTAPKYGPPPTTL